MCIRRQVRHKCIRCGGLSCKDGSELETCGNPIKDVNGVCPKVKIAKIPRFEETTGWCDACGSDSGVGGELSPDEEEDAIVVKRQFFGRGDHQQQPVEQQNRYEELLEASRQRLEAQHTANEQYLEGQAAQIKNLDEQRANMEEQFAEAYSGNVDILAKQREDIARLRHQREVLQQQIDQEQASLQELRAAKRRWERDAEQEQEQEQEQEDLGRLRRTRQRNQEEFQGMRSARDRDNIRHDGPAPYSYPSRFVSPGRCQSSHLRADRYSAGGSPFTQRSGRCGVRRNPGRGQSSHDILAGRGSHHHRRESS